MCVTSADAGDPALVRHALRDTVACATGPEDSGIEGFDAVKWPLAAAWPAAMIEETGRSQ